MDQIMAIITVNMNFMVNKVFLKVQRAFHLYLKEGIAAGHRIDTPVSLIDLLPTFLDLAGAEPYPATDGTSFAQELSGEASVRGPHTHHQ